MENQVNADLTAKLLSGNTEEKRYITRKFVKKNWWMIVFLTVFPICMLVICGLAVELTKKVKLPDVVKSCPEQWIWFKGQCYYFSERTLVYHLAAAECQSQFGVLSPLDATDFDFILKNADQGMWYVGLQRASVVSEWKYINGSTARLELTSTISGSLRCVVLNEKTLRTFNCFDRANFICQRVDNSVLYKSDSLDLDPFDSNKI